MIVATSSSGGGGWLVTMMNDLEKRDITAGDTGATVCSSFY